LTSEMIEHDISEIIKKQVNSVLPAVKILIFGSRARGDFKYASDYDIMIVTKNTIAAREKIKLCSSVAKRLASCGIDADVLMNSEEEIKSKKELRGHIVRTVMKEGVAI